MNWTEGNPQRHSRGNHNRRHVAKQRRFFTKAKPRSPTRDSSKASPVSISFLQSRRPSKPGALSENYEAQQLPRHPSGSSKPEAVLSPSGSSSKRKRERLSSHGSAYNHDGGLEEKRRRLLGRADWAGVGIQKPLPMNFAHRVSPSNGQKWGFGQRGGVKVNNTPRWREESNWIRRKTRAEEKLGQMRLEDQSVKIRIGSQSQGTNLSASSHSHRAPGQQQLYNKRNSSNNPFSSPRFPLSSPYRSLAIRMPLPPSNSSCVTPVYPTQRSSSRSSRQENGSSPAAMIMSVRGKRNKALEPARLRPCILEPSHSRILEELSPAVVHHPIPQRIVQLHHLQGYGLSYHDQFQLEGRETSLEDRGDASSVEAQQGYDTSSDFAISEPRQNQSLQLHAQQHNPGHDNDGPQVDVSHHNDPLTERKYIQEIRRLVRTSLSESPLNNNAEGAKLVESGRDNSECQFTSDSRGVSEKNNIVPERFAVSSPPSFDRDQRGEYVEIDWDEFVNLPEADNPEANAEKNEQREGNTPSPFSTSICQDETGNEILEAHEFDSMATWGSSQTETPGEGETCPIITESRSMDPTYSTATLGSMATGPSQLPTIFEGPPSPTVESLNSQCSETMPSPTEGNSSVVVQVSDPEPDQSSSLGPTFLKPEPFVGRLAKTPAPVAVPLVQLTMQRQARPRGRQRKSLDGRADIRGLQEYHEDPIDESPR